LLLGSYIIIAEVVRRLVFFFIADKAFLYSIIIAQDTAYKVVR